MPNQSDVAPKDGKPLGEDETAKQQSVSASQVASFLRCNPNFFADHPGVLDALELPERTQGDGIVDLRQFMVQRLREEIDGLTDARDDLLATGRNNLHAQARIHKAIVSLLDARSFEQFVEIITTDLAAILDLDMVVISVEHSSEDHPPGRTRGVNQILRGMIAQMMGPGGEIILRDHIEGEPEIYGAGAGLIRSDALIRLAISPRAPQALLALGSRQPDHFHQGQGIELLNFLARVLETCFRSWLDLPPS
jgi:uncharacterized protein YigA (DUF484 family)